MALTPTFLKFMIKLHKEIGFTGPVLTLGSQGIFGTLDDLRLFFRQMGCPFREVEPIRTTCYATPDRDFVHAQVFFQMMGIDEYYDLDKFDYDKPKLRHDLNTPISEEMHGRFSLVVEVGTMEHVFDIRQVMENIVRLLRVGGSVVHFSVTNNWIDHGFYTFSPSFFYEFYAANGFEDFRCYLIEVGKDYPAGFTRPCPFSEYTYGSPMVEYIDESKCVVTLFAARKARNCDVVRVPDQGAYDPATRSQVQAVTGSAPSFYEQLVPKPLRPVVQPLRPFLGRLIRGRILFRRLFRLFYRVRRPWPRL